MEPLKVASADKFRHELTVKFVALTAKQTASLQCRAVPEWLAELVANELHPLAETGGSDLAVSVSFGSFDRKGGGRLWIDLKGRSAMSQTLFAKTSIPISWSSAKLALEESTYAASTEVLVDQEKEGLGGNPASALPAIQQCVRHLIRHLVELATAQCAVVAELTQLAINVQALTGEAENWQIKHLPDVSAYRIWVPHLADSPQPTLIIGLDQSPHGTWHNTSRCDFPARYPAEVHTAVVGIRNLSPGAKADQVLSAIREANTYLEHLILQQIQC